MQRRPMKASEWGLLLFPLLALGGLSLLSLQSPFRQWWQLLRSPQGTKWEALEWSPDNQFIAIGGGVLAQGSGGVGSTSQGVSRGDVEIRDISGRTVIRLVGRGSPVWEMKFSPDGSLLLSINRFGIRVWNVATGTQQISAKLPSYNCTWSEDGKYIHCDAYPSDRLGAQAAEPPSHLNIDATTGSIASTTATVKAGPSYWMKITKGDYTAVQRPVVEKSGTVTTGLSVKPVTSYTGGEIDITDNTGKSRLKFNGQSVQDMKWRGDNTLIALGRITDQSYTVGMVLIRAQPKNRTHTAQILDLKSAENTSATPTPVPTFYSTFESSLDVPQVGKLSQDGQYLAVWNGTNVWLLNTVSGSVIASWPREYWMFTGDAIKFSPDSKRLAWIDRDNLHCVETASGEPAQP